MPTSGPINPHKPFVSRRTLTSSEVAAPLDFEVALKMRNFADLQARVAKGERISPAEMAAKYEPLATDYNTVVAWLKGQGFQITRQSDSHLGIFVRGTIGQIQQAFGLTFARVQLEGKEYTSAVTAPTVPASIAPLLVGINGLQPHAQPHKHSIVKPASLNGTNPPYLPSQIAQAYNASGLYTTDINGAGQSIAIIIDTFPATSDLVTYWKNYKVSQSLNNIQFIQVIPGTLAAPSGEETLDVEWSSSIAPGAKVRVYATTSLRSDYLDEAYEQVYEDAKSNPSLGLHQMSMSYGEGETYYSQALANTDDQYFAALAGAGVTIFASAGDGGSTPGPGPSSIDSSGPLQVESPASDPNVTGVGGTSLTLNSPSGSEASEVVWNDGTSGGATGGGASQFFQKPGYQSGNGVGTANTRFVPDLACSADEYNGAEVFLNNAPVEYGGTSWASPTVAGFFALINEARANAGMPALGGLGYYIYPLIGTTNFRDIVSGTNSLNNTNSGGLYSAATGYDETTGIGVPLVQTLAQTLVGSSPLTGVQVQPLVQTISPGQSATITASASGNPTSFQWQVLPVGSTTWSNVTNGSGYAGATTANLTIVPVTAAMSGNEYECVVTYSGGSTLTSAPSVLIVDTPLTFVVLAGTVGKTGSSDGLNTAAQFSNPTGIALDTSGNLYVADSGNSEIREVTTAGSVTTLFSSPLKNPDGIAVDNSGNLYVADTGNNLIRKISGGVISTLGGSQFNAPRGIAVDASGTVYVADSGNNVIRKITSGGTVSTLAGSGVAGYVNQTGTAAEFNDPTAVAVDGSGNVYVADFNNKVVREITSGGKVSTLAGQAGVAGDMDGVGTAALFNAPNGVAVDANGNVYVTDALIPATTSTESGNNLVRKISATKVVSTLGGQAGVEGGANGTGTAAQFDSPQGVAVNGTGEVFVADTYNQSIRAPGIAPFILAQPVSQVLLQGQPVTFSVSATGSSPLSYQWYKGTALISGATSSTYSIAGTSGSDTAGYSVVVSNAFGSVTSNTASFVSISAQPMAETVTAGNSATFSITVSNMSLAYTYQWLFNGSPISGATGTSYTISDVSSANAGNYAVMLSGSFGTVTTSPVSLTVNPAPIAETDTPTMPQWSLILLAGLLLLAASFRANENQLR